MAYFVEWYLVFNLKKKMFSVWRTSPSSLTIGTTTTKRILFSYSFLVLNARYTENKYIAFFFPPEVKGTWGGGKGILLFSVVVLGEKRGHSNPRI